MNRIPSSTKFEKKSYAIHSIGYKGQKVYEHYYIKIHDNGYPVRNPKTKQLKPQKSKTHSINNHIAM